MSLLEMPIPGIALLADQEGAPDWKFRALSGLVAEAVFTLDRAGRIRSWNAGAESLFGHSADEALGNPLFPMIAYSDTDLGGIEDSGIDLFIRHKNGERLGIQLKVFCPGHQYDELLAVAIPLTPPSPVLAEEIGRQRDEMARYFSVRQERDERLIWQLMHYDPLTGLPNRLLLAESLSRALVAAAGAGEAIAAMVIDVFHFKYVNDVFGQAVGDYLLTTVAARLSEAVAGNGNIGRLDGAGFGVFLTAPATPREAELAATRLLAAITEPISVAGHEVVLTASIGIALFPNDGQDANTLFRNAAAALGSVPPGDGSRFLFYSAEQSAVAAARLALEEDLRRALAKGEFELHYQPQVDLRHGTIDGAEALIRWRRPDGKLVPPGDFIPLAEETGLIVPMGEWVLQTACEQLGRWQATSSPHLRMAVNLSARQFQQSGLTQHVSEVVRRSGIRPASLELEITESMLMRDVDAGCEMLRELRQQGVRVAIDDFGTGYSSLSYLKRFPIDTLKIDGSFVRHIPQDDSDAAIVRAIIALAHSLHLEVVAEGVETESQLAFMREHDGDKVQGYLFSRPLAAEAFGNLLNSADFRKP